MKNIIYILIFLPSLLFSQETKNMEFVGFKEIMIPITMDENHSSFDFLVDPGFCLKINQISTGSYNSLQNVRDLIPDCTIHIDSVIVYHKADDENIQEPFHSHNMFLSEGLHKVDYYYRTYDATEAYIKIYCQEFKLTSP